MTTTIECPRTELRVPPGLLVPEIEDELTRRELLIGTGSLLALGAAGCGSGGERRAGFRAEPGGDRRPGA